IWRNGLLERRRVRIGGERQLQSREHHRLRLFYAHRNDDRHGTNRCLPIDYYRLEQRTEPFRNGHLNVNPSGGGPISTRIEQNNAAAQYTGDWATNTDPNHSGGSAALTLVNSVTLSF